jgi:hypothetical protein
MKLSLFVFIGIFFQFICIPRLRAQQSPDSLSEKSLIANINQVYLYEIGDNAQIYHGREFIRNGQKAIGFPFYESDNMMNGTISYQGEIYPDRNLYYNLVSDQLIIDNYTHNALITLSPEKVDSFNIGSHVFVPLNSGKSNGLEKDGYYEQLVSGEPALFARREKKLVVGTGSEESRYIQYNNYFIRINQVYYPVDGKNALLDVLKDREDELKKYIRSNKINFRKNPESSLVMVTNYYSRLKH